MRTKSHMSSFRGRERFPVVSSRAGAPKKEELM
jgi:hypothetical protein